MDEKLVFRGKIVELNPIANADRIESATVVCGAGGKWRGVVTKGQYRQGDSCIVFLPDAVLPPSDQYAFMEKQKWRVKMCRFRGTPSEVLIMPWGEMDPVGTDLTQILGVKRFFKPIPAHLQGMALGDFPGFIPKTDEPNYQSNPELVESLIGKPYYITEKCDGSSTTAYKRNGHFGVCSRNLELKPSETNGYWVIARRHKLEENLPEGIALQWETSGPGIQGNPMGLKEIEGFAFNGYNIEEHRYLTIEELLDLTDILKFPMARILEIKCLSGFKFDETKFHAQGSYPNGSPREGIVVRSVHNYENDRPISFKVINLDYE